MTNPLRKYVVNIITQLIRACLAGPCRHHAHYNHHKKSYYILREHLNSHWWSEKKVVTCVWLQLTISTHSFSGDGIECKYRAGEHMVAGINANIVYQWYTMWAFIRVVTALGVHSFLLSVANWLTSAVCEGHNFATKNSLQGVPSASRQDRKVGTQLNFGLDW